MLLLFNMLSSPGLTMRHSCCCCYVASVVSDSVRPHRQQPTRLLRLWDFLGKSAEVGCHFLLQGIFPTQGSNLGLLHCWHMVYRLSHQGSHLINIKKTPITLEIPRVLGTLCPGKGMKTKYNRFLISSVKSLSPVWLCNPMDCSMPGLPVHYQLNGIFACFPWKINSGEIFFL